MGSFLVQAASLESAATTWLQGPAPSPGLRPGWFEVSVEAASAAMDSCQIAWRNDDSAGFGPPFELGRNGSGRFIAYLRFPRPVVEFRVFPGNRMATIDAASIRLRSVSRPEIGLRLIARGMRVAARDPVRALRAIPRALDILLSRGSGALPRLGIAGREGWRDDYAEWIQRRADLAPAPATPPGRDPTSFSVVMPVYRPQPGLLQAAIDSVRAQSHANWELILADDASGEASVTALFDQASAADPRIKVVRRAANGGISNATNSALDLAEGEFVVFLDQDDLLSAHALQAIDDAIARRPSAVIVYSDEDKLDDDGRRFDPFFKPDWDPDLILAQNYLNHLTVMRRDAVMMTGGLNPEMDGAQDHDLILRVSEGVDPADILHVPDVLYHWRAATGSTARSISEKPHVLAAAKHAVSNALARRGVVAMVTPVENAPYQRVIYPAPASTPLTSIIIPTRDRYDLLSQCLRSLETHTAYQNWEVVLVDNGSTDPQALDLIQAWGRSGRATIVRDDGDFNFSRLINRGAAAARGEVLLLLNNDIEVIQPGWLTEMVSQLARPNVGCVGAKLLFPNNTVQHAGVILGMGGIAGHWQAGAEAHDLGYGGRLALVWRPSAVTAACMATRREAFVAIGGFDETLTVSFNDVDYCLRAREAGWAVVWTPHALLRHHESASRGRHETDTVHAPVETEIMQRRWGALIAADPAFNPNLSLASPTTRLRR